MAAGGGKRAASGPGCGKPNPSDWMNWAETASLDVNTFHVANVTDLKRDQAQRALRRILADAAPRLYADVH